ncbi:MAG: head-tail connector protein [Candidatus Methanomethylicaceae archaeon]
MLKLLTPPAVEPISLSEIKLHLRIDGTSEDTLLNVLITTARQHVEAITRRALIQQQWQLILDDWWDDVLELPLPPLISVDSLTYKDASGGINTMPSSDYIYETVGIGRLRLAKGKSFPSVELYSIGAIKITFTAGYGSDGVDVPEPIRHAIRLLVGHYYENREAVIVERGANIMQLPVAVDALLAPFRVWSF